MSAIRWTAAAIRLMALWLALGVMIGLPAFLASWFSAWDFGQETKLVAAGLRATLLGIVATVATAVMLWRKSITIARWIWPEPVADDLPVQADVADLQRAIFVAAGVYLVAHGVPHLIELAASSYALGFLQHDLRAPIEARATGALTQIIVGVSLILGSDGISRLVARARSSRDDVDAADSP